MKKKVQVFAVKVKSFPWKVCETVWKVGKEDPRRLIHAVKVGLALTLVSLLYLIQPLYKKVGKNAIWAVMTVVVVFEFTAGATLCKGMNRGLGTLCAGLLALGIGYIADECGTVSQAVLIGAMVFLIGSAATYVRFFPYIKNRNHDYGVIIFLLTFNLITVSSYRMNGIWSIALNRFYSIVIGSVTCLAMSLLVFPNWSGDELHNITVHKLEVLATSIEACVKEYFDDKGRENNHDDNSSKDPVYNNYKTILDSKSNDERLALYASWEPRDWKRCNRLPWDQYVKLGEMLRHFGCTSVSLHECLHSEIQTPRSARALFRSPCTQVAGEVSKVLMELADSIRQRRLCPSDPLSHKLEKALEDLSNAIHSQPRLFLGSHHDQDSNMQAVAFANADDKQKPDQQEAKQLFEESLRKSHASPNGDTAQKVSRSSRSRRKNSITSLEFSEALPFAAFASLLLEMVVRLDPIIEQVEELGRLANFKEERDMEIVLSPPIKRRNGTTKFHPHRPTHDTD